MESAQPLQTNQEQPKSKKSQKLLLIGVIALLLIIILGFLGWGVYDNQKTAPQPNYVGKKVATQSASPSAEKGTTEKDQNKKGAPVKVYFSKKPDSDNDPSKVFAVSRTSPDAGVAKYSLNQLIAGPTASEKADGYYSEIELSGSSNCEGGDFVLNISSGKATVRFCKTFKLFGVMSDARVQNQIETTLLQFSSVSKVAILGKDGYCLFDASGQNECDV
jgi:hypothetical protein